MKKRVLSFLLAAALCFMHSSAKDNGDAAVAGGEALASLENGESLTFIVELENGGLLEQTESKPQLRAQKAARQAALKSINDFSLSVQEQAAYLTGVEAKSSLSHIMNGFIIEGNADMLETLSALSGVKAVYVSQTRFKQTGGENVIFENGDILAGGGYTGKGGNAETDEHIGESGGEESGSDSGEVSETLGSCITRNGYIGLSGDAEQYSGRGTVIGIIDSEFNINHDVFGAVPEDARLAEQDIYYFLSNTDSQLAATKLKKDITIEDVYKSEKIPFAFDYCGKDANTVYIAGNGGHGSHVAGIAAGKAASGEFSGTAKDAQLVLMKASPDGAANGTFSDANVLMALDDLVKLQVDVINMSLGAIGGFYQTPAGGYRTAAGTLSYTQIYQRISNAGIVVSASAGNEGRYGEDSEKNSAVSVLDIDYSTVGSPASYEASTAVASADAYEELPKMFLINGKNVPKELVYADSSEPYLLKSFAEMLVESGGECAEFEFASLNEENLSGKIAYINRAEAQGRNILSEVQSKGAAALVMVSDSETLIKYEFGQYNLNIPFVCIKKSAGEALETAAEGSIIAVYEEKETDGKISEFSSRGITPEFEESGKLNLRLKPEITAMGGRICSAISDGSYGYKSGTSMSAPQYSGAAAVMIEYLNKNMPSVSPTLRAEQLLASTATVLTENGVPVSPIAQGAGRINIQSALSTPVVIYNNGSSKKVKLELGEITPSADGADISVSFRALNQTNQNVTYSVTGDVLTDNYIIENNEAVISGTRRLENSYISGENVTVAGRSGTDVNAVIHIDAEAAQKNTEIFENGFYVSGFIRLKSEGLPELSIPYVGFYGNWADASVFAGGKAAAGENSAAALVGCANGSVYSLKFTYDEAENKNTAYISPDDYTAFYVGIQNSRNLYKMQAELYKVEYGERAYISGKESKYIGKAAPDKMNYKCNFSVPTLADGEYEVVLIMQKTADSEPQTAVLGLVVDKEAPQLSGAELEGNTLAVYSYDNSGKSYAVLQPKDAQTGGEIEGQAEQISEYECVSTFNVAGLSLADYNIAVYDYTDKGVSCGISGANGFAAAYIGGMLGQAVYFPAFVVNNTIINPGDGASQITAVENQTIRVFAWDRNMIPVADPY